MRATTFSIVIPAFNVVSCLRECLDSVLAQTFADWEAICVDDGSTDGSGAILDEYAAKDGRFRVIHQKNDGVSAARNAGLDAAKGEWVVFLDGDDVLAPQLLETLLSHTPTGDVVRWGYERFEENGALHFHCEKQDSVCCDVSNCVQGSVLHFENLNCWTLAFPRKFAENVRFRNYICGEDRLFCLEVLLRARRVVILGEKLYGYRTRSGSYVNSSMTLRKLKDEIGYRLEFLRLARGADKEVRIRDCNWLESYFAHSLLVDVGRVSVCDSDAAWQMWFDCIADASNFIGCTAWTRGLLCVCRLSQSKSVSLVLCRHLPAVLRRIGGVFRRR